MVCSIEGGALRRVADDQPLRHARTLQHEVERGETIASASGQRDYQIVDQPRNHEDQETSRSRPYVSI